MEETVSVYFLKNEFYGCLQRRSLAIILPLVKTLLVKKAVEQSVALYSPMLSVWISLHDEYFVADEVKDSVLI